MYKFLSRSVPKSHSGTLSFTDICRYMTKIRNKSSSITKRSVSDPSSKTEIAADEPPEEANSEHKSDDIKELNTEVLFAKKCHMSKKSTFAQNTRDLMQTMNFHTTSTKSFFNSNISQSKKSLKTDPSNISLTDNYKKALAQCQKIQHQRYRNNNPFGNESLQPIPIKMEVCEGELAKNTLRIESKVKMLKKKLAVTSKKLMEDMTQYKKIDKFYHPKHKEPLKIVYPIKNIKEKIGFSSDSSSRTAEHKSDGRINTVSKQSIQDFHRTNQKVYNKETDKVPSVIHSGKVLANKQKQQHINNTNIIMSRYAIKPRVSIKEVNKLAAILLRQSEREKIQNQAVLRNNRKVVVKEKKDVKQHPILLTEDSEQQSDNPAEKNSNKYLLENTFFKPEKCDDVHQSSKTISTTNLERLVDGYEAQQITKNIKELLDQNSDVISENSAPSPDVKSYIKELNELGEQSIKHNSSSQNPFRQEITNEMIEDKGLLKYIFNNNQSTKTSADKSIQIYPKKTPKDLTHENNNDTLNDQISSNNLINKKNLLEINDDFTPAQVVNGNKEKLNKILLQYTSDEPEQSVKLVYEKSEKVASPSHNSDNSIEQKIDSENKPHLPALPTTPISKHIRKIKEISMQAKKKPSATTELKQVRQTQKLKTPIDLSKSEIKSSTNESEHLKPIIDQKVKIDEEIDTKNPVTYKMLDLPLYRKDKLTEEIKIRASNYEPAKFNQKLNDIESADTNPAFKEVNTESNTERTQRILDKSVRDTNEKDNLSLKNVPLKTFFEVYDLEKVLQEEQALNNKTRKKGDSKNSLENSNTVESKQVSSLKKNIEISGASETDSNKEHSKDNQITSAEETRLAFPKRRGRVSPQSRSKIGSVIAKSLRRRINNTISSVKPNANEDNEEDLTEKIKSKKNLLEQVCLQKEALASTATSNDIEDKNVNKTHKQVFNETNTLLKKKETKTEAYEQIPSSTKEFPPKEETKDEIYNKVHDSTKVLPQKEDTEDETHKQVLPSTIAFSQKEDTEDETYKQTLSSTKALSQEEDAYEETYKQPLNSAKTMSQEEDAYEETYKQPLNSAKTMPQEEDANEETYKQTLSSTKTLPQEEDANEETYKQTLSLTKTLPQEEDANEETYKQTLSSTKTLPQEEDANEEAYKQTLTKTMPQEENANEETYKQTLSSTKTLPQEEDGNKAAHEQIISSTKTLSQEEDGNKVAHEQIVSSTETLPYEKDAKNKTYKQILSSTKRLPEKEDAENEINKQRLSSTKTLPEKDAKKETYKQTLSSTKRLPDKEDAENEINKQRLRSTKTLPEKEDSKEETHKQMLSSTKSLPQASQKEKTKDDVQKQFPIASNAMPREEKTIEEPYKDLYTKKNSCRKNRFVFKDSKLILTPRRSANQSEIKDKQIRKRGRLKNNQQLLIKDEKLINMATNSLGIQNTSKSTKNVDISATGNKTQVLEDFPKSKSLNDFVSFKDENQDRVKGNLEFGENSTQRTHQPEDVNNQTSAKMDSPNQFYSLKKSIRERINYYNTMNEEMDFPNVNSDVTETKLSNENVDEAAKSFLAEQRDTTSDISAEQPFIRKERPRPNPPRDDKNKKRDQQLPKTSIKLPPPKTHEGTKLDDELVKSKHSPEPILFENMGSTFGEFNNKTTKDLTKPVFLKGNQEKSDSLKYVVIITDQLKNNTKDAKQTRADNADHKKKNVGITKGTANPNITSKFNYSYGSTNFNNTNQTNLQKKQGDNCKGVSKRQNADTDQETLSKDSTARRQPLPTHIVRKLMKIKLQRDREKQYDRASEQEKFFNVVINPQETVIQKPAMKTNHSDSSLMKMYLLEDDLNTESFIIKNNNESRTISDTKNPQTNNEIMQQTTSHDNKSLIGDKKEKNQEIQVSKDPKPLQKQSVAEQVLRSLKRTDNVLKGTDDDAVKSIVCKTSSSPSTDKSIETKENVSVNNNNDTPNKFIVDVPDTNQKKLLLVVFNKEQDEEITSSLKSTPNSKEVEVIEKDKTEQISLNQDSLNKEESKKVSENNTKEENNSAAERSEGKKSVVFILRRPTPATKDINENPSQKSDIDERLIPKNANNSLSSLDDKKMTSELNNTTKSDKYRNKILKLEECFNKIVVNLKTLDEKGQLVQNDLSNVNGMVYKSTTKCLELVKENSTDKLKQTNKDWKEDNLKMKNNSAEGRNANTNEKRKEINDRAGSMTIKRGLAADDFLKKSNNRKYNDFIPKQTSSNRTEIVQQQNNTILEDKNITEIKTCVTSFVTSIPQCDRNENKDHKKKAEESQKETNTMENKANSDIEKSMEIDNIESDDKHENVNAYFFPKFGNSIKHESAKETLLQETEIKERKNDINVMDNKMKVEEFNKDTDTIKNKVNSDIESVSQVTEIKRYQLEETSLQGKQDLQNKSGDKNLRSVQMTNKNQDNSGNNFEDKIQQHPRSHIINNKPMLKQFKDLKDVNSGTKNNNNKGNVGKYSTDSVGAESNIMDEIKKSLAADEQLKKTDQENNETSFMSKPPFHIKKFIQDNNISVEDKKFGCGIKTGVAPNQNKMRNKIRTEEGKQLEKKVNSNHMKKTIKVDNIKPDNKQKKLHIYTFPKFSFPPKNEKNRETLYQMKSREKYQLKSKEQPKQEDNKSECLSNTVSEKSKKPAYVVKSPLETNDVKTKGNGADFKKKFGENHQTSAQVRDKYKQKEINDKIKQHLYKKTAKKEATELLNEDINVMTVIKKSLAADELLQKPKDQKNNAHTLMPKPQSLNVKNEIMLDNNTRVEKLIETKVKSKSTSNLDSHKNKINFINNQMEIEKNKKYFDTADNKINKEKTVKYDVNLDDERKKSYTFPKFSFPIKDTKETLSQKTKLDTNQIKGEDETNLQPQQYDKQPTEVIREDIYVITEIKKSVAADELVKKTEDQKNNATACENEDQIILNNVGGTQVAEPNDKSSNPNYSRNKTNLIKKSHSENTLNIQENISKGNLTETNKDLSLFSYKDSNQANLNVYVNSEKDKNTNEGNTVPTNVEDEVDDVLTKEAANDYKLQKIHCTTIKYIEKMNSEMKKNQVKTVMVENSSGELKTLKFCNENKNIKAQTVLSENDVVKIIVQTQNANIVITTNKGFGSKFLQSNDPHGLKVAIKIVKEDDKEETLSKKNLKLLESQFIGVDEMEKLVNKVSETIKIIGGMDISNNVSSENNNVQPIEQNRNISKKSVMKIKFDKQIKTLLKPNFNLVEGFPVVDKKDNGCDLNVQKNYSQYKNVFDNENTHFANLDDIGHMFNGDPIKASEQLFKKCKGDSHGNSSRKAAKSLEQLNKERCSRYCFRDYDYSYAKRKAKKHLQDKTCKLDSEDGLCFKAYFLSVEKKQNKIPNRSPTIKFHKRKDMKRKLSENKINMNCDRRYSTSTQNDLLRLKNQNTLFGSNKLFHEESFQKVYSDVIKSTFNNEKITAVKLSDKGDDNTDKPDKPTEKKTPQEDDKKTKSDKNPKKTVFRIVRAPNIYGGNRRYTKSVKLKTKKTQKSSKPTFHGRRNIILYLLQNHINSKINQTNPKAEKKGFKKPKQEDLEHTVRNFKVNVTDDNDTDFHTVSQTDTELYKEKRLRKNRYRQFKHILTNSFNSKSKSNQIVKTANDSNTKSKDPSGCSTVSTKSINKFTKISNSKYLLERQALNKPSVLKSRLSQKSTLKHHHKPVPKSVKTRNKSTKNKGNANDKDDKNVPKGNLNDEKDFREILRNELTNIFDKGPPDYKIPDKLVAKVEGFVDNTNRRLENFNKNFRSCTDLPSMSNKSSKLQSTETNRIRNTASSPNLTQSKITIEKDLGNTYSILPRETSDTVINTPNKECENVRVPTKNLFQIMHGIPSENETTLTKKNTEKIMSVEKSGIGRYSGIKITYVATNKGDSDTSPGHFSTQTQISSLFKDEDIKNIISARYEFLKKLQEEFNNLHKITPVLSEFNSQDHKHSSSSSNDNICSEKESTESLINEKVITDIQSNLNSDEKPKTNLEGILRNWIQRFCAPNDTDKKDPKK